MANRKQAPINTSVVERIIDFSGGLNTTISPSLLNNNEAQKAVDVSFEQKGTIIPRKGRRKRYDVNFNSNPCTGIAGYYKKDGTSRLLIASGDKLYSDEPHIDTKYTTQADFEQGEKSTTLSTSKTSGSVVFDVIKPVVDTATLDAITEKFGVATNNYGYKFTPKFDIKINNYKFKAVELDAQYVITIYKVSDKSVVTSNTYTAKKEEKTWVTVPTSAEVKLTKGIQYVLAIQCSVANGLYGYKTITFDSNITLNSDFIAYSVPAGGVLTPYPETATTVYKVLGVVFDYQLTSTLNTFYLASEFNLGTYSDSVVSGDTVTLAEWKPAQTFLYDTQADMQNGSCVDTSTTIIVGSITLGR
jgi:hypothetical protein